MSNDPDLIERPCLACSGNGFFLEPLEDDHEVSQYEDCTTCGGEGVVLR